MSKDNNPSKENKLLEILGASLYNKVGSKVSTVDALRGKKFILLYFSASWCPPCKAFTPILAEFYKKCAKEAKLEIIYVSSDRSVEAFNEYYGKMPWLAIPTDEEAAERKTNLAKLFDVSGIPMTIVLDGEGKYYMTDNPRTVVTQKVVSGSKEDALNIIQEWNHMDLVPLDEAAEARRKAISSTHQSPVMTIISYLTKNPMFIFALLYFFKIGKKYYDDYNMIEPSTEGEEEPPIIYETPKDSEF